MQCSACLPRQGCWPPAPLLPPASPLPDSKPAQAEEAPGTAAASLDDGKLRILYSNGSNGGNTVLCGNTVLYQAASSETVYLVPDTLTGTVRYYLRQWSAPGTPHRAGNRPVRPQRQGDPDL